MSNRSLPLGPIERRAVFRRALIDSLPVLMGYSTMGFVAGVLLAAKGGFELPILAPLWGFLTSLCCFSGTFNFAVVKPIANHASLWAIAMLIVSLNFRYAFYGFTMLARWKQVPFLQKLFLIHMLTDENFALEASCKYTNAQAHLKYCTWVSILNLAYWTGGVTVGALTVTILHHAVKQEYTVGMEFAMVALFLVIFTDQLKGILNRASK